ncbi:MAG: outer membrane lipoprotein carrier protein LolA [Spirosomataceae bacterium]|jgi:outer membrane lipoprotein-sorting protein|nr:outer membrane lipoprotein carrier protein LolA [Bacteroidota bacterium]
MINFLRVLAFSIVFSPALAQDKKAESILDAMSAKYKALKTFNANFTYGVEGATGKLSNVFTGNVTVKGNKFKLKTAGQEIFNNGKEVYTYVKETNEVNISDYNPNDDSDFSPSKIYTIYKKGYKYKFKEENAVGGVSYEVVELSPTNGKSNVKMIQITVNKKDKSIKNWKVWDKSGKKTVFRIDKFVPNAPAADAMFIFDKSKYPGVEIVDLR